MLLFALVGQKVHALGDTVGRDSLLILSPMCPVSRVVTFRLKLWRIATRLHCFVISERILSFVKCLHPSNLAMLEFQAVAIKCSLASNQAIQVMRSFDGLEASFEGSHILKVMIYRAVPPPSLHWVISHLHTWTD